MIGKLFKTTIQDAEKDDEYGEVTHPIGSVFRVGEKDGENHVVAWQGTAIDKSGAEVPAKGMWCLWTPEEIATHAEELL